MSDKNHFNSKLFSNFEIDLEHFKLSNKNAKKLDDGKFIYLFGKNGSGKTTLSREIINKLGENFEVFVFNKDYVAKNIFVEDIDDNKGLLHIKQDAKNKRNSFKILLGKDLISMQKKSKKISDVIKILSSEFDKENDYYSLFKHKLLTIEKEEFIKINSIKKMLLTERKQIKKIDSSNFEKNKKDFLEKFENFIKYNERSFFEESYNELIEIGIECIHLNKEIELIEKTNKSIKSIKVIKFHETAIELQENDKIEFLEKEYDIKDVIKYVEKFKTNIHELKNKLKNKESIFYKKYKELEENNFYKKIIDKDLYKFHKLKIFLISKDVEAFKKAKIEIKKYEEMEKDLENWLQSKKYYFWESNYSLNEIKNEFYFLKPNKFSEIMIGQKSNLKDFLLVLENFEEMQKNLKDSIKEYSEKNKEEIIKTFTKNLYSLTNIKYDLDAELKALNKEWGLELPFNSKGIEFFSEGEKSSFALAYFLTDLEINLENIKRDFIIFIDDPFDSNDHYKYMNFKKIKLNGLGLSDFRKDVENKTESNGKIIVSTHNINILSSFMINLCKDYDGFAFMKIKEKYEKSFFVKQIINNNGNIKIEDININLIFSFEKKLASFFESYLEHYEYKLDQEIISQNEWQILKLISCILIKINDFYSSENRMKYKFCFKEFSKNKKDLTEIQKKLREIDVNFSDLKLASIRKIIFNFFKNIYEKNEFTEKISEDGLDGIINFLFLIRIPYQEILLSNDKERYKIITHKLFYSSNLIHVLEN